MARLARTAVQVGGSFVAAVALCVCGGRAGDTSHSSSESIDAAVGTDASDAGVGDAESESQSSNAATESDGSVDVVSEAASADGEPTADRADDSRSSDTGPDRAYEDQIAEAEGQDAVAAGGEDAHDLADTDASAADAAAQDAVADVAVAADAGADDALEANSPCATDGSCSPTPPGWTMVALSTAPDAACPTGFTQGGPTELYSGYSGTGVCECGACSVTTQPDCVGYGSAAQIYTSYDVASDAGSGACATSTTPTMNADGFCDSFGLIAGDYSTFDLAFLGPTAPSAGTCSSSPTQVGDITYTWGGRMCAPDPSSSACEGSSCTVALPTPYRLCVSHPSNVACPANTPFTQAYYLSTGFLFNGCSGCFCTVNSTCTGTVELFSDTQCMNNEFDVAADGVCRAAPTGIGTVGSYRYAATLSNVSCSVTQGATASAQPSGFLKLCCTP